MESPAIPPDLVIVTGAGRGIGKAIATDIARDSFVLCISQSSRALTTAEEIRRCGHRADGLILDLQCGEEAGKVVGEWVLRSRFKRIGVVLAAAILGPRGPLVSGSMSEWERTFRVNVFGNLAITQAVLGVQKENRFGRILFFAGGGAAYQYPIFPAYAASKAALVRIVENLHEDLKAEGDFATAILAPGAVETDTLASVRACGAEIRTIVGIEEPTAFARAFLLSRTCAFSGRFVHVRDEWKKYLNDEIHLDDRELWKLRRVE